MNNSFEFTFFYLINKCILLFKYINYNEQKNILNDIKIFINRLQEIFSHADFMENREKKNRILEILNDYFKQIIDTKIYELLDPSNKRSIIDNVEIALLDLCCQKMGNNSGIDTNVQQMASSNVTNVNPNQIDDLEKKMNNKIKNIYNELEKNIKTALKDYFDHTQYVEYDLDKKFNSKLELNNIIIENKVKDIIKELIKTNKIDAKLHSNIDSSIINQAVSIEIDERIRVLADIFNENIKNIFENLNVKISDNEKELIGILEEKINKNNFNKNNFNIIFDKETNEIRLYYCNEILTSSKINIKGLIGPKGPIGEKGEKGETPIIRKIDFTKDKRLKLIIQEGNNLYELISDDIIPPGPQGMKGEKGDPGKSVMDLKWNQENVMRVDSEHKDSLIITKSLCVGDKSHCLKDNSLSIGGGVCYQSNSIAVGANSKTLDGDSVALYGTCIGKKAFSYRAENVDENNVVFGKRDRNDYNIDNINMNSKEINLECNVLRIRTNKYENNKFVELEERISTLERKMVDILRKI